MGERRVLQLASSPGDTGNDGNRVGGFSHGVTCPQHMVEEDRGAPTPLTAQDAQGSIEYCKEKDLTTSHLLGEARFPSVQRRTRRVEGLFLPR